VRLALTFVLSLLGCRFGGAEGDALELVEPWVNAELDAGDSAAPSEDEPDPPRLPTPAIDSGAPPSSNADGDAATDAEVALDAGEALECRAPTFTGCDPVRNTGCSPGLTQCVAVPTAVSPTGQCVLSGVTAETPCSESPFSTSCPPQHGCVGGRCSKYCACDSDCPASATCSEALQDGGASDVRACNEVQP
jgi:hypothetical protein